jgi:hypothetical protein
VRGRTFFEEKQMKVNQLKEDAYGDDEVKNR